MTSASVRVVPAADLRGATFELPGVQDGVTSRFEAAADGKTGTLTLHASTAVAADARAINVQGRSGVGTGAWVGMLTVTTTSTLTAKTIFVDAVNGEDTNDGTQTRPFKTLKKALTKALAGDTLKLAKGSHTKQGSGDTYPVLVPNGVTIGGTLESNGAKSSFLSASSSPAGETGLTFAGDATVKDLELDVFGTAIAASKGKLTLNNLNLILNRTSVSLTGSAQATLNNLNVFMSDGQQAVAAHQQAQFTMEGGKIEGTGGCGVGAVGLNLRDSAQTTVHNTDLENIPGSALLMVGTSKATLDVQISRTNPAGCHPAPSVRIFESASFTFTRPFQSGGNGALLVSGIILAPCLSPCPLCSARHPGQPLVSCEVLYVHPQSHPDLPTPHPSRPNQPADLASPADQQ